jgi:hypothetical protein
VLVLGEAPTGNRAIVDGYKLVPLAVIGRERRRLLDPKPRARLASRPVSTAI